MSFCFSASGIKLLMLGGPELVNIGVIEDGSQSLGMCRAVASALHKKVSVRSFKSKGGPALFSCGSV